MNDMNKPYKLLIHATLEQQTAFSTGGNREAEISTELDHVLAKNGKGQYTLRGTGLAGAFLATARNLYETLPCTLTEESPQEQQKILKAQYREYQQNGGRKDKTTWLQQQPRMEESLLIFHHAHPTNISEYSEVRDNVAIRQKTGAAKDGAKFDAEILPAGTGWDFLMEVDQYRDTENSGADSIALNVIRHWQQYGCWLGKDVARGLGYMHLKDVKIYQLTSEHIDKWPDAGKTPCEPLQGLSSTHLTEDKQAQLARECPVNRIHAMLAGTIQITVGQASDGYGLDMLSVGGNNSKDNDKKIDYPKYLQKKEFLLKHREKLLKPQGQIEDEYLSFSQNSDNDIDFSIATTKTADGNLTPYIPGSSIRGSMRHALSWLLRKDDQKIWEPGGENKHPDDHALDIVLKIFGSTKHSASLLISDAMPVNDKWQAVVLEMHAEDEFTQGVFGKGKFDRTCLTKGTFKAHFQLEASDETELEIFKNHLDTLNTLGEQNRIPIGGGQWKGLGWITLSIAYNDTGDTSVKEPVKEVAHG